MTNRLLLVEPDTTHALALRDSLLAAGFTVQLAHSFEQGVEALGGGAIDLLVPAVRLGKFNGLHLVIRTRVLHPEIPAILMGHPDDHSSDVERLNIAFLPKPVDGTTLAARAAEILAQRAAGSAAAQRRWPRKHAHLPAVVSNANLDVVELSYGGLRLEGVAPAAGVGSELVITFPSLGFSVTAVAKWTKPVRQGAASWCGAEIKEDTIHVTNAWRGVVDTLN